MKKLPTSLPCPSVIAAPTLRAMGTPEEFAALHAELIDDIKPSGAIERMYVENAAEMIWELKSLRRIKTLIVRTSFRTALENLLKQVIRNEHYMLKPDNDEKAEQLALDYFKCEEKKTVVVELLSQFGLDERAIAAEAFKLCFADIGTLDKMLISSEKRFNKAIRSIAAYRKDWERLLRRSADRMLDVAETPDLAPDQRSAVA
jgi:hypothetical protein